MDDTENLPADVAPAAEAVIPVTLHDFCADHSRPGAGGQTEMLAAFFNDEQAAGHHKDTAAAFAERYAAFCRRPA